MYRKKTIILKENIYRHAGTAVNRRRSNDEDYNKCDSEKKGNYHVDYNEDEKTETIVMQKRRKECK